MLKEKAKGFLFLSVSVVIFLYMVVVSLQHIPVVVSGSFYVDPQFCEMKPLFYHLFHFNPFPTERGFYIFESLFYMTIHILMSLCGALLVFNKIDNNKRKLLGILILSGLAFMSTHLGIAAFDYFFRGTKNYLSPYHRPFVLSFEFSRPMHVHLFSNAIGMVLQLLPVQLWSSLFVFFFGLIKYRKLKTVS